MSIAIMIIENAYSCLLCVVSGFLIDTTYVFMKPKDRSTSTVVVLLLLSMQ